ncbi:MAG: GIY-YIG nuclease family protein [Candidatus Magasanikbacteria bacterium]|mgnify:FL=1|jgi:putative endonuclease|nr:GIY-YIG nuclease family protein [Candidatus Magasanikbacteria bacterium]MBT4315094.1 GIY-YIG nuclease family protein [Candidatus Magasanikbacteria bacterium]MBT4547004.1 GIY-YIG nuclease family protein [Candidatus Magasanikbacteria bacterium]MBT6818774.1 GIY-YIG nuclease family protein [Candidatus Magasanikbacteria bacterium]
MFHTYVLKNDTDSIYIGQTSNLDKRIDRHNDKLPNKTTSYTHKNKKGAWILIHKETFKSRSEAIKREKELKSYNGRKWIKNSFLKNKHR